MHNNKDRTVVFIYENIPGGELVETELIIDDLCKNKNINFGKLSLNPLTNTGFFSYFLWLVVSIVKSAAFIIKNRPNVVYVTTFTAGMAAVALKTVLTYKIIFHYHGSRIPPRFIESTFIHRTSQQIKYFVTRLLHKIVINGVDKIIVPSEFTRKKILGKFKVSKNTVQIIPNGIDLQRFDSLKKTSHILYKKLSDEMRNTFVITTIGRFNKDKNLVAVIKSFAKFSSLLKKPTVLILLCPHPTTTAEKSYRKTLLDLISVLKVGDKIYLIEGRKSLEAYYRVSDLVISLSKVENFPISMLESFASGVVYSAYPAGEIKSILRRIDPVLLIEESGEDKIAAHLMRMVSLSKNKKAEIVNNQCKFVENFSIKKTSSKVYKLISSFLEM